MAPSLASLDDEIDAETVRLFHTVILQNMPDRQLSKPQCKGNRAKAVSALRDDGIYQTNMRAIAAAHPEEVQMRNQHPTEYDPSSAWRKCRQVGRYVTGILAELRTGKVLGCAQHVEKRAWIWS